MKGAEKFEYGVFQVSGLGCRATVACVHEVALGRCFVLCVLCTGFRVFGVWSLGCLGFGVSGVWGFGY